MRTQKRSGNMLNAYSVGNNGIFSNYIIVNVEWVEAFGLNEGIFLSILHTWILSKTNHNVDFIQGRYWVHNTYDGWLKSMPWIGRTTLATIISKLKKLGILLCEDFNGTGLKSAKWYSIDYDVLKEYMRVHTMKKHGAVTNITLNITTDPSVPVDIRNPSNVVQNSNNVVQNLNDVVQNPNYEVQNLNDSSSKFELDLFKNRTAPVQKLNYEEFKNCTPDIFQTVDTPQFNGNPNIHNTNIHTNRVTNTHKNKINSNSCRSSANTNPKKRYEWDTVECRNKSYADIIITLLKQKVDISIAHKLATTYLEDYNRDIYWLEKIVKSPEWNLTPNKEQRIIEHLTYGKPLLDTQVVHNNL